MDSRLASAAAAVSVCAAVASEQRPNGAAQSYCASIVIYLIKLCQSYTHCCHCLDHTHPMMALSVFLLG